MTPSLSRALPFYVKLALVLFSLIALGYLSIEAKEILSPLIFSLLFSVALLPLVNFFEKKLRLPGGLAAGLSVILLVGSLFLLFYILGSQFARLAGDWPQFQQQINITIDNLQQWVEKTLNIDVKEQMNYVN